MIKIPFYLQDLLKRVDESIGLGTTNPGAFKAKVETSGTTPLLRCYRNASGTLNETNKEQMSVLVEVDSANAVTDPFRGIRTVVSRNTGSSGATHALDGEVGVNVNAGEHAGVVGFGYANTGTGTTSAIWGADFHAVRESSAGNAPLQGVEIGVHPRKSGGTIFDIYGLKIHNQKNWGATNYRAGYGLYVFGETGDGSNAGFDWPIYVTGKSGTVLFCVRGTGETGILEGSPLNPLAVNRPNDDGVVIDIEQGGTIEGTISVSGTVVSYNSFMGAHFTQLKKTQAIPPEGSILAATGEIIQCELSIRHEKDGEKSIEKGTKNIHGVQNKEYFSYVKLCSKKADKKVYGVYHAKMSEDSVGYTFGMDKEAIHQIASVGLYRVRVTDTNGNIEEGDYIQSSEREGEGERQEDDVLHNYTVAKAIIKVIWEEIEEDPLKGYKWKLIPATLHCG